MHVTLKMQKGGKALEAIKKFVKGAVLFLGGMLVGALLMAMILAIAGSWDPGCLTLF